MKIIFSRKLSDGRTILVYDKGTERNNLILIITSKGPAPDKIIDLKDSWNWEDKLPKLLGVSKDELGLK